MAGAQRAAIEFFAGSRVHPLFCRPIDGLLQRFGITFRAGDKRHASSLSQPGEDIVAVLAGFGLVHGPHHLHAAVPAQHGWQRAAGTAEGGDHYLVS